VEIDRSMTVVYVARSRNLQKWSADVGLTAHVYKVGVADDGAAALAELGKSGFAGETDWKLVKADPVEGIDEATLFERLGRKEKMVDANLYPRLKGTSGIVKVKPANVQMRIMTQSMMSGEDETVRKAKPDDIAAYLIQNAQA
jgi:hypothetical protein